MRKIIVTLGIFLVLLLILFVLAFLNLNFFINGNKDYFLSQIENSIGRKINVSDINTGFSEGLGIRLKNFSLDDDKSFSDSEFVKASDVQVNLKLIPLISKKIVISKLILNNPIINIIQDENGTYNFSTLSAEEKSSNGKTSNTKENSEKLALFASSILVKNGQINYIDRTNGSEFQIQKVDLRIKDLGFNKKVPIDLEAAVLSGEQNINLSGIFGPLNYDLDFQSMPVSGTLNISELDIKALKKFIPKFKESIPEGLDLSGPLRASFKFSGSSDELMLRDIKLGASVFGANVPNLEILGNVGPIGKRSGNLSLDTEFELKKANLSKLRNFVPLKNSFPNSLSTQGTLDLSGKISGTAEDLDFKSVKLDITGSRLAIIGKFLKPKNSPFVITTEGKISKSVIEIKHADLVLSSLKLNTKGKISRGTTNLIDLSASSNRINLTDLSNTFPSIKEYNPSGQLQLQRTNLRGELGKGQVPEINGSLVVSNATIAPKSFPKPISDINTRINFTGKTANIKEMSLNLGKSNLKISSQIDNLSPLILSYELSSPKLYVSDINKNRPSTKKPEVIRDLKSQGKISTKHSTLIIDGSLSSSEAVISEFELQDISSQFNIHDETLKIEDLRVRAYEGTIDGKASYSMGEDSQFSLISDIRGFNLKSFLNSRNSENVNKIRGRANLDINVFGSGSNWNEIQDSLKGTAKAEILDGAVLDINISDEVLKGITGVPGLTFLVSPSTKEKYPQIFTAQDTEFDEFRSSFVIEKGIMETNDLKIKSQDYLISAQGIIELDGKVDLQSQLILSNQFSDDLESDIPDIKYIKNKGSVEIPFTVSGRLPKARVKPDITYLAKLVQRVGIRSVIEELSSGPDSTKDDNNAETDSVPKKKKKRIDQKIFDEIKDLF